MPETMIPTALKTVRCLALGQPWATSNGGKFTGWVLRCQVIWHCR